MPLPLVIGEGELPLSKLNWWRFRLLLIGMIVMSQLIGMIVMSQFVPNVPITLTSKFV